MCNAIACLTAHGGDILGGLFASIMWGVLAGLTFYVLGACIAIGFVLRDEKRKLKNVDESTRPWYKLHRSTFVVFAIPAMPLLFMFQVGFKLFFNPNNPSLRDGSLLAISLLGVIVTFGCAMVFEYMVWRRGKRRQRLKMARKSEAAQPTCECCRNTTELRQSAAGKMLCRKCAPGLFKE